MKKNGDKKVLLVSHNYYPCLAIDSHRSGKFAKYLREFGWEPVILTRKEKYYPVVDEALQEQIPKNIEVVRTGCFYCLYHLKKLVRFIRRGNKRRRVGISSASDARASCTGISLWFDVPHDIGWMIFGLFKGIIAARKCDVIWGTSPTPAALCIGALLSKITKRPFIADLRDPWHLENVNPYPTVLHKKINRWWEQFVLNTAEKIVVVTEEMAEMYRNQYPQQTDEVLVIENGYDPDDFRGFNQMAKNQNRKVIQIGYLGALYQGREKYMLKFLQAIKKLDEDEEAKKITLYIRGATPEIFTRLVNTTQTGHLVDMEGTVPYKESLTIMHKMDVLLLVGSAEHKYALPGKLFEYIGARKPILAITPEGALSVFIRTYGVGISVDPADDQDILAAMKTLNNNYEFYASRLNQVSEKFSRKAITERLAELLDEVTKAGSGRSRQREQ